MGVEGMNEFAARHDDDDIKGLYCSATVDGLE